MRIQIKNTIVRVHGFSSILKANAFFSFQQNSPCIGIASHRLASIALRTTLVVDRQVVRARSRH
jgi:hypothetical protein